MKNNTQNFWIDISFTNTQTVSRLQKAITVMQEIHNWTVEFLNGYFLDHAAMPAYIDFRKDLNIYIRKNKLRKHTQQYSMEKAAENTFPYFHKNIHFTDEMKFSLVQPLEISEIQIRTRKVWRKYLAEDRGITTRYGTVFMEGDWKAILREQAGEIPLDLFPFLWHSVTVAEGNNNNWKIHFNHHAPHSSYAKKAEQELEAEYGSV